MMTCPFCKQDIETDSLFCDLCGKKISICPGCGKPGKGKICTSCGRPLADETCMSQKNPPQSPFDKGGKQGGFVNELILINKNLDLELHIKDGDIIGRSSGRFSEIFSKYPQVSSKHLKFDFDKEKGWFVTDLGSTNGTQYNGKPLVPNSTAVLSAKSYLCIANIEFFVEIPERLKDSGTIRIAG